MPDVSVASILRVLASLTAAVSLVACATGDEQRRAERPTVATGATNVATCRPARQPMSAIVWSCVIPPGADPIVHGLSGIYYDRASSTLLAASDDDETYAGDPARVLRFQLEATPAVTLRGVLSLTRPGVANGRGNARTWQLEAIAPVIEGGAWTGSFFVGTEHDALQPDLSSQIYRCTAAGACEPAVQIPREFTSSSGAAGLRDNEGVEGLSVSPDGGRLFAAIERWLVQEAPGSGERGRVRLLEYALDAGGAPLQQYAYALDPPAAGIADVPGVSAILARSRDRLLVLERSYAPACGNTIRLYEATLDPTRALAAGQRVTDATPVAKQLLIDLTDAKDAFDQPKLSAALENFEGMTLGPDLPDGSPSLLLVSDDNRRSDQITALVSLRLASLPTQAARRWKDGDLPVCPK
jgi:hypothetical protein